MAKYLNKFYEIIDKIGKHNFVLIVFIFVALLSTSLYQTFSIYTESEGLSFIDNIKTYSFILKNNNEENSIIIASNSSKNVDITVSNESETDLKYGLYYGTTASMNDINIGYLENSTYLPSGVVPKETSYVVTIKVDNFSSENVTINFGLKYGFENGGDLGIDEGDYWFSEYIKIEDGITNKPNLDNGNLIPVYYDDTEGVEAWKKADYLNRNNSWYNYENKMWANAVIISDEAITDYNAALYGTEINEEDIIAFYVWIPRYKYRVWNIMRQGGDESTYAYDAYSKGIQIEFEKGTKTTGNVECTYDVTNTTPATVLSDHCTYNKNDEILLNETDDEGNAITNLNYTDAWYTHPAFTFGNKKIEGFWIGKFETSGTADETTNIADNPTILPDVTSLRNQNISQQFTTSKVFQNYLSNEVDAHMLTNLEWASVAYLTHSIYGMCNGISCEGVKLNNSSGYYTGRSGGNIAGNIDTLATRYGDTTDTSSNTYNEFGYYDYKGNSLNSAGTPTTKEDNKIASTTGNITGVYDMSGGAYEYVMGNMVTETTFLFNPGGAVLDDATNPWNGLETISLNYYNAYSYGITSTDINAYNRARLGDATAEVLGTINNENGSWHPNEETIGSSSYFLFNGFPWSMRGGYYSSINSSLFDFDRNNGAGNSHRGFRVSIV